MLKKYLENFLIASLLGATNTSGSTKQFMGGGIIIKTSYPFLSSKAFKYFVIKMY